MQFIIRELDRAAFDPIITDWKQVAGPDEFNSELKIPLEHLLALLKPRELAGDPQSAIISVLDSSTDECVALVELIDAERKGLTKILKFILSPKFWNLEDHEERKNILANIHTDTYTQVIESKLGNGTQEVKVYGRDDLSLGILKSVHDMWPNGDRIAVKMAGRWLSVTAPVEGN